MRTSTLQWKLVLHYSETGIEALRLLQVYQSTGSVILIMRYPYYLIHFYNACRDIRASDQSQSQWELLYDCSLSGNVLACLRRDT
jgi:hypothetical protein